MSEIAIRIEHLSKIYQIGHRRHDSFGEMLSHGVSKLFRGNEHARSERSREFWALKDVSFQVKHGEVLGIIGRNGAGKSTLLKILSRITNPTSGRVEIYGRVGSLLEVGTGFHPELTGRDNISLNGAILGMKKAEIDRRFDEIVGFAEISEFLDTPVKRYSSGMYVRLAFAVAAHLDPEILIVDEVLSVGDSAFQNKCLRKMEEVRKGGRTVIVVSHHMPMIENLCQRVILLNKGEIVEEGFPQHVLDKYLKGTLSQTSIALSERTDRSGIGEMRITGIEFFDRDKNPINRPVSGHELRIRVHYKSKVNKVFRNHRVLASVVNKEDRAYLVLSTDLVRRTQLDLRGDGFVDFVIPELPLFEGDYYFHAAIETTHSCQDWIQWAKEMSVADSDYYGTGKVYPHEGWRGLGIPVRYRWELGEPQLVGHE